MRHVADQIRPKAHKLPGLMDEAETDVSTLRFWVPIRQAKIAASRCSAGVPHNVNARSAAYFCAAKSLKRLVEPDGIEPTTS